MTIGQLTEAVTSAMGKPIKMATVRRAVKVTEIEIVDPRAINFQGRDRAKRLATLINLILTDLEVQFGYKPTQTITDELLTLTRGQGTTLDVE
jgi:hypothetical protein